MYKVYNTSVRLASIFDAPQYVSSTTDTLRCITGALAMANETFTDRFGKSRPVPDILIPKSVMTSIMRLQEDYDRKGKHYKLTGVALEVIILGIKARRNSMEYAAKTKDNKAISAYIKAQLSAGLPIDRDYVSKLAGVQQKAEAEIQTFELDGEEIADESSTELTDTELEAATSPNGRVS
jgi:hypothetical protein